MKTNASENEVIIYTEFLDDHEAAYFQYLLDELERIGCLVIKK